MRGVSVFFVVFTLSFTTGSTRRSTPQGACRLLGVLFYFPGLALFVSS